MFQNLNDPQAIGAAFEEQVVQALFKTKAAVYRGLYVPYFPGCEHYAQVDIVCAYSNAIVAVECKQRSGQYIGNRKDEHWLYRVGGKEYIQLNPIKQNQRHSNALYCNLGVPVHNLVVVSDNTIYKGDATNVVRVSDVMTALSKLADFPDMDADTLRRVTLQCLKFANPTEEIKQNHRLYVNSCKNRGVEEQVKALRGVEFYCLMCGEIFYAFTDEKGTHWGSEKLSEATLFNTEEEAVTASWQVPGSEVGTLSRGGVEALSDLPSDLDDLTPDEYAYEVGARPW